MNVMILAAGKGTRLKPLTDIIPKALVPVCDKPLLQRVIEHVDDAGNTIVINVHHHARQIRNFIDTTRRCWQSDIRISDESDQLLETGGGLRKAAPLFTDNEPILIHNVDILSNIDIQTFYKQATASPTAEAVLLVSQRKTTRYLLFNDDMRLVGWTNIQTGEVRSPYDNIDVAKCRMYAFSGIHIFSPSLFPLMQSWPDKFSIIDFYLAACEDHIIQGIAKDNLRLLDVGKLDTLESAATFLSENNIPI